ncbi:MAG: hypothetical protein ACW991_06905 [Candidatus Hodarchaeales archaeon]
MVEFILEESGENKSLLNPEELEEDSQSCYTIIILDRIYLQMPPVHYNDFYNVYLEIIK